MLGVFKPELNHLNPDPFCLCVNRQVPAEKGGFWGSKTKKQ